MIQGQHLTITHTDKSVSIIVLKEFSADRINYSERFCGLTLGDLSKDTCEMKYLTTSAINCIRISDQNEIELINSEEK
tara:strand:+ start:3066 stop:3299 length:234 start_codon:yes stop_codon:yes gene_type:complete